jgi:hypothetical protein
MPSTHEPVHLLEPSDLLVPLDLSDRQADLFYRSARAEPAATSPRRFTRASSLRYGLIRAAITCSAAVTPVRYAPCAVE